VVERSKDRVSPGGRLPFSIRQFLYICYNSLADIGIISIKTLRQVVI
jgi:hypothetical protein